MQISTKKRCSKANFDHFWHEKPNLPPCIAHPTQDPPAHIELSFVAKNTKENKKGRRKLTVGPDGPAWTEQQWLWRRTSPCSSPCLSPGRSPSVYLMPCLSPVLRWGQGKWDPFEQHPIAWLAMDSNLVITCSIFTLSVNCGSFQVTGFATWTKKNVSPSYDLGFRIQDQILYFPPSPLHFLCQDA